MGGRGFSKAAAIWKATVSPSQAIVVFRVSVDPCLIVCARPQLYQVLSGFASSTRVGAFLSGVRNAAMPRAPVTRKRAKSAPVDRVKKAPRVEPAGALIDVLNQAEAAETELDPPSETSQVSAETTRRHEELFEARDRSVRFIRSKNCKNREGKGVGV